MFNENKGIKHYLLTGLFSILPITFTYIILLTLFNYISNPGTILLQSIFNNKIPRYFPEILGFFIIIFFIYIIGIIISNVIGEKLYSWVESIIFKIPFVSSVYKTIKQIVLALSGPNSSAFKKVVYIERLLSIC